MDRTPYEELLHYREECKFPHTVSLKEALEDLICSHRWMSIQLDHVNGIMEELEKIEIIRTTVDKEGVLDILELIKGVNMLLVQRDALLVTIIGNDLEKEFEEILSEMVGEFVTVEI